MRRLLHLSFLVSSIPTLCNGFLGANLPTSSKHSPVIAIQSSADNNNNVGDSTTTASTAVDNETEERFVEAVPILSSVTDPEAVRLREELFSLSEATNRGFTASSSQKKRARDVIFQLARFNPTTDPASPYYAQNLNTNNNDANTIGSEDAAVTLAGKWDLVFTDAPDITSLDTSRNPLATATLGRIGQECTPPFIKNVIEWKKPDWIDQLPLPFAGGTESRVLQKVCTKASATPDNPLLVDLKLVGIDLVAPPSSNPNRNNTGSSSSSSKKLQEDIERDGLPEGFLRNNPLELRGPLTAPFGQFEILYLDEELRMIKTRGFVAVNVRCREDWF